MFGFLTWGRRVMARASYALSGFGHVRWTLIRDTYLNLAQSRQSRMDGRYRPRHSIAFTKRSITLQANPVLSTHGINDVLESPIFTPKLERRASMLLATSNVGDRSYPKSALRSLTQANIRPQWESLGRYPPSPPRSSTVFLHDPQTMKLSCIQARLM